MKHPIYLVMICLLILAGAACGTKVEKGGPVTAVELYQQAFAAKDADKVSIYSCADWEVQALMEMDSFQAVDTKLENLACAETGNDGDAVLVKCQGIIKTTYGEEVREFDLSTRTWRMIQESGEWLVCGAQ